MSRFEQEWALVPTAARVVAVLAALGMAGLAGFIFLAPPIIEGEAPPPILWGWFLLASGIPGALIAGYVLLVGYVWGDAKRRRMNAVLWLLLAIFIPNAIGVILYFILRDPLPVACPSCGSATGKEQAFCAACGMRVRICCPECGQAVQSDWGHCGHCGTALRPATESPGP